MDACRHKRLLEYSVQRVVDEKAVPIWGYLMKGVKKANSLRRRIPEQGREIKAKMNKETRGVQKGCTRTCKCINGGAQIAMDACRHKGVCTMFGR